MDTEILDRAIFSHLNSKVPPLVIVVSFARFRAFPRIDEVMSFWRTSASTHGRYER